MEITGPGRLGRPSRIYQTRAYRAPRGDVPEGSRAADQVQISDQAKRMSMMDDLKAKLDELPDIRQDKVDDVRAQIEDGTYETPEKLDIAADRLLSEMLGD